MKIKKTQILKINPRNPEIVKVRIAAKMIKNGKIVAFPTETVYGLGADALNPKAIKKIFKAKSRPSDNPLIVHVKKINDVKFLVTDIPPLAKKLMKKYWPGPLTLIFKKSKIVPHITTGGLESIAIRMPSHKIALSLIKESKTPIAAPSANFFGKPSPTRANHVLEDLEGRIDLVIDGGRSSIGLESTVIDVTGSIPTLLRPGKITIERLRKEVELNIHPSLIGKKSKKLIPKSPGMKYRHYSPKAKIVLLRGSKNKCHSKIVELVSKYNVNGKKVGVISMDKKKVKSDMTIFIGERETSVAKNLFHVFRDFDKNKIDIILVCQIKEKDFGFAIMNRLKKAAQETIVM